MSVKTPGASKRPPVKGDSRKAPTPPVQPPQTSRHWWWAAGLALTLFAALIAYWPAMHGGFVFDDVHMDFASAHPETLPLRHWTTGARPLAGLTYWVNYQLDSVNPFGYHLFNVLLHTFAALMVFLIVRKILEWAAVEVRRGTIIAGFCAAVFLLHPVQTEAV